MNIRDYLHGQETFLVKKCLKVINAKLPVLLSKKGCDASNFYDEELAEKELEFSDDEKEREHKKALKQAKKKKRGGNSEEEEGEIA